MISRELARRLTGLLDWHPVNSDQFFIPRPEIEESVFTVSDMVVEIRERAGRTSFHFNGTTEWALDSLESDDAVWLPREEQLRERLGDAFLSLDREGEGFVVTVRGPQGAHHTAPVGDGSDAYALALLHALGADDSAPAGESADLQRA
ncbi:hypothetical protein FHX74_001988 [Friedmanniella endophytica]|uniref:Pilus assembly protein CpaE n=1 Tax=Microlunatus kandeliicorticis TaxID=1759536 RepID=A0A7W3P5W7_9ACTN|nr:pilus assembly protein CpaE [Microlunatus kandeliicorticis]MBA8794369.1 hypothetical protein [Microlunatus kandeliicorticis]